MNASMFDDALQLFTIREAAEIARCTPATVRAAIADGRLAAWSLGQRGRWRIRSADLCQFLGLREPSRTYEPQFVMLTLHEVAALSRFSNRTLRDQIKAGRLRVRDGGWQMLVTVDDYAAWAGIEMPIDTWSE